MLFRSLYNLSLEPTREPTPSISLSGSSDTHNSKSKSGKETDNDQDKIEGSVKDNAQSKELLQQQISISPQKNLPPLNEQQPSVRIELEKEWETFNDLINVEGQNTQTL